MQIKGTGIDIESLSNSDVEAMRTWLVKHENQLRISPDGFNADWDSIEDGNTFATMSWLAIVASFNVLFPGGCASFLKARGTE